MTYEQIWDDALKYAYLIGERAELERKAPKTLALLEPRFVAILEELPLQMTIEDILNKIRS